MSAPAPAPGSSGPREQGVEQAFGLVEAAGQVLALGPLRMQIEGERMLALPVLRLQQRRSGAQVGARGIECHRDLGPPPGREVEPREISRSARSSSSSAPKFR